MESDLAVYTMALYQIKSLPLFGRNRMHLLIQFSLGKFNSSRASYIKRHFSEYYKPGDDAALIHRAYQETILKDIM